MKMNVGRTWHRAQELSATCIRFRSCRGPSIPQAALRKRAQEKRPAAVGMTVFRRALVRNRVSKLSIVALKCCQICCAMARGLRISHLPIT